MSEAEIDMTMIDQIKEMDDDDQSLLRDIVDTYLDDAPKRLADVHSSLAAKDMDALHRAAHTLKGSSSNLGLLVMVKAAADLVTDVRANKTDNLDTLVADLDNAWVRTQELIKTDILSG